MSIDYLKGEQNVAGGRLPVYAIGNGVLNISSGNPKKHS
jgi:hypothetical protein